MFWIGLLVGFCVHTVVLYMWHRFCVAREQAELNRDQLAFADALFDDVHIKGMVYIYFISGRDIDVDDCFGIEQMPYGNEYLYHVHCMPGSCTMKAMEAFSKRAGETLFIEA